MLTLAPRALSVEAWLELHGSLIVSHASKNQGHVRLVPRWGEFRRSHLPVVLDTASRSAEICPSPRHYKRALRRPDLSNLLIFSCSIEDLRRTCAAGDLLERSEV